MAHQPNFQSYKDKIDKKQNRTPLILGILSVLLIISGVLLIWFWINDGTGIQIPFFQTDTPTPTPSATPLPATMTPTNTLVPSATIVPSITPTVTASAPFTYQVESGDSLYTIAEKFEIDEIILIMVINGLTSDFLSVGQELLIPNPDMILPTPTLLPPGLQPGDIIEYMVLPGDSVKLIAEKFLSTEAAIVEQNELEDAYLIHPGQILLVPYWLITPTFGPPDSTATPIP